MNSWEGALVEIRVNEHQLFRYSAVTWNAHRIHLDREYAKSEGYRGLLIHSHLQGAIMVACCAGKMGVPTDNVMEFDYRIHAPSVANEQLQVTSLLQEPDRQARIQAAEVSIYGSENDLRARGRMTFRLTVDPVQDGVDR